jgi:hypothetical protein
MQQLQENNRPAPTTHEGKDSLSAKDLGRLNLSARLDPNERNDRFGKISSTTRANQFKQNCPRPITSSSTKKVIRA